jgi:chromosomal replication initiator protein DnaA
VDLNPRYRFEAFVVGPSNRLAFTAAQAVAQNPGEAYNPLFLYGRSGLGKTHLLHAVGWGAMDTDGTRRAVYRTLEEFVGQYHAAVAAGQLDAFRRSTEETDVLLLDDVQFLAKHREMQSELLRFSEHMQGAGKQVVLSSDRPPSEIEELDERLISRLSGGLLVDLSPPDYETRLAILRRKADERGMVFAPGVLDTVAEIGAGNVRELVGLVNRLSAFQAVSDAPLTPVSARALLTDEDDEGAGSGRLGGRKSEAAGSTRTPDRTTPLRTSVSDPSRGVRHLDAGAAAPDEFGAFLSAVTRTVAQSIDAWKSRIGEAVVRWQGEGFRTARLEELLTHASLPDIENVLAHFAADVEMLKALASQAGELDPATAGHSRFRDPDRLAEAQAFVQKLNEGIVPPPGPTSTLKLEDYIGGAANDAVVRAAKLVAQDPGKRYNPLFITGPSGVGKTHLLHAIGNALANSAKGPRVVACLSAQAFIEDLLAAIEAGNVEWWRRRYRRADAFLLDDTQLIGGKEQTQDELFNLFNVFADAEKQLVFAADRLPAQLDQVASRLVTRFEGGLVVELAAPDRPMRAQFVRRLLDAQGVQADDDVVEYLAARPADSARAVQGLVNRAFSAMDPADQRITVAAARTAIEGRTARVSQQQAISALIPSGIDPTLGSREKLLWDWPEIGDRLVEDLR